MIIDLFNLTSKYSFRNIQPKDAPIQNLCPTPAKGFAIGRAGLALGLFRTRLARRVRLKTPVHRGRGKSLWPWPKGHALFVASRRSAPWRYSPSTEPEHGQPATRRGWLGAGRGDGGQVAYVRGLTPGMLSI